MTKSRIDEDEPNPERLKQRSRAYWPESTISHA